MWESSIPSNHQWVKKCGKIWGCYLNIEEYCISNKNVAFERLKFSACIQQESQEVDNYLTELKTLEKSDMWV